jgi:hypothetical protein
MFLGFLFVFLSFLSPCLLLFNFFYFLHFLLHYLLLDFFLSLLPTFFLHCVF